jgi:hypothetical protein
MGYVNANGLPILRQHIPVAMYSLDDRLLAKICDAISGFDQSAETGLCILGPFVDATANPLTSGSSCDR